MSGLMKTFFDRLTDLVTSNKETGRLLKGKLQSYLLRAPMKDYLLVLKYLLGKQPIILIWFMKAVVTD